MLVVNVVSRLLHSTLYGGVPPEIFTDAFPSHKASALTLVLDIIKTNCVGFERVIEAPDAQPNTSLTITLYVPEEAIIEGEETPVLQLYW